MDDSTPCHQDLFDEQGFLEDPELWSRDLALAIAAELRLGELTETHWDLIDRLRGDYLEGCARIDPCRALGLPVDCAERLFGGVRTAWRVAGLPASGSPRGASLAPGGEGGRQLR
ncbi:TusE/DsrC/DsvC family sulfur relay protein [Marichromatium purpuratum 984]|uniref:TusE/DsrC/DsvC family sulfur relay protein n=1 Tax=Marichromatium purpuratum 984 TaxID=765910 RepID=W0DX82_MARPU|nr:TusE/DsrC/DsvC family sulfur relay protein [Marichromatium purpuratum]AHF03190.1 TusE/DsrC/DsvC family sulfur relay protein [Marichromatium purpuratum 984]